MQYVRAKELDEIFPYLWFCRLSFCNPYFESEAPFDTGNDSRLAINVFMELFNSSMYKDSISFKTNRGINLRF